MALLFREAVPFQGLRIVHHDPESVGVQAADTELRDRIALLGRAHTLGKTGLVVADVVGIEALLQICGR